MVQSAVTDMDQDVDAMHRKCANFVKDMHLDNVEITGTDSVWALVVSN